MYVTFTKTHEKLFTEFFLPSYQDTFPIEIRPNKNKGGPWHSPEYLGATKEKLHLILELIKTNPGKVIIVSDVDIMFYRPVEIELNKLISQKDLLFSAENPKGRNPNTGFTVLKCNDKNEKFYTDVINSAIAYPTLDDQQLITKFLQSGTVEYDVLPRTFWNDSIGGTIPKDAFFHHANYCGPTVEGKVKRLRNVKDIYDFSVGGSGWSRTNTAV